MNASGEAAKGIQLRRQAASEGYLLPRKDANFLDLTSSCCR